MIINIEIPVFSAEVLVCIAKDFKDVAESIDQDAHFRFEDDQYLARTTYKRKTDEEMGNSEFRFRTIVHSKTASWSILAHEMFHVTSFILDGIGHQPDHDNDEVQAYLLQYLCGEIEREFLRDD